MKLGTHGKIKYILQLHITKPQVPKPLSRDLEPISPVTFPGYRPKGAGNFSRKKTEWPSSPHKINPAKATGKKLKGRTQK